MILTSAYSISKGINAEHERRDFFNGRVVVSVCLTGAHALQRRKLFNGLASSSMYIALMMR